MGEIKACIPPEPASSEKIMNCIRRSADVAYKYEVAEIKISIKLSDGTYHNDIAWGGNG